jgi:pimeloyl-ACP methyl ester carboxylesterase
MNKYLIISLLSLFLTACGGSVVRDGEVIYVRNQGADLPAYVYGNTASKTFMVLLHGGPGGNGLEYRGGTYVEDIEKEIAVVYWDQRGQGNSRGNGAKVDLNMDLLMDDLDHLVNVLKQHYGNDISLFLFGHSWGGTYGTKYLMSQQRQDQFKGWIEADGAHDIPKLNVEAIKMFIAIGEDQIAKGNSTTEWKEIVDFAKGVDTTNISIDEGGQINSHGYTAEGLISEIKAGAADGIQMPYLTSPVDPISGGLSGSITANKLVESGIEDIALTDSLYKITIPSLFLWGKYDFVVPPQLGIDAVNLVSSTDKEYIEYEFSGHSPMNGEGKAFAAAILEFVARNK